MPEVMSTLRGNGFFAPVTWESRIVRLRYGVVVLSLPVRVSSSSLRVAAVWGTEVIWNRPGFLYSSVPLVSFFRGLQFNIEDLHGYEELADVSDTAQ